MLDIAPSIEIINDLVYGLPVFLRRNTRLFLQLQAPQKLSL